MTFQDYLKDKGVHLLVYALMISFVMFILISFQVNQACLVAVIIVMMLCFAVVIFYDYHQKSQFYSYFLLQLKNLDQKYLICELIKKPSFLEGKILYDSLYEINKAMLERINDLSLNIDDFKDYIEMWIHEVKIPLSHLTLTVHNHKSEISPRILEQVRKLENQVDQVLYYIRSQTAQKDYLVKTNSLSQMIKNVIVKNKDYFIYHQLKIYLKDLDYEVVTDSKWLEFIVNQILNNSFQYSQKHVHSFIEISARETDDVVILSLYDNGIGIQNSDLSRVFEKTFTGQNGRLQKKSTGMGLYICQKLCQCLGHDIEIESEYGKYTCVHIVFHKNHYYDVVR